MQSLSVYLYLYERKESRVLGIAGCGYGGRVWFVDGWPSVGEKEVLGFWRLGAWVSIESAFRN